ncbi:MAG: RHS repeat-associated core domain-containing protein [Bacteriovorax sp.]|jgi:RHS repeat-associated protein
MKSLFGLVILFISINSIASDFFSDDKKGFWITPKSIPQNQLILKNGEDFTFEGDICVVKWGGESHHQKCQKVPAHKLIFKATFPDSLHDVSDKLVITQSNDKKSWKYSLKTGALNSNDLNQLTLTVGTGDKKSNELLSIKAKLEKRILILSGFKDGYAGKHSYKRSYKDEYKENLNYINKLITYLENLVAKIDVALQSNPEILAQIRQPLQVENKLSAPFYYSSNFSGHKLTLKIPVGVPFDGEKADVEASLTNLSDKSFYFPEYEIDNDDEKDDEKDASPEGKQIYRLNIEIDGHSLASTIPFDLAFGETKTISVRSGKLNPNAYNKIKVNLERSTSGKFEDYKFYKRSLGNLSYDLPVIEDTVAPVFSNLKPLADTYHKINPQFEATFIDGLGRIDSQTLKVVLDGTRDVTSTFSIATENAGATYTFVGNIADLSEGDHEITYSGSDFAGNSATVNLKTIHFDKTAPLIFLFATDNVLTNNPTYKIALTIADASPTQTKVIQNGMEVYSSTETAIDYDATLAEGINTFEIQSIDAAGNVAISKHLYNISLDTIAPTLADIAPINGSNIYNLDFNLTGKSNEQLLNLKVNGKDYIIGGDKKAFSVPMKAFLEGEFPVQVTATDLAQNSTTINVNYHIILKVLNSDLIAIIPNLDNVDKLIISGAPGAARPGAEVKLYAGFFNKKTIIANSDGGFEADLDFFDSLDITATDLVLNRTESATLKYNVDTTLAGIVRDTNDLPLAGVTVTIAASGQKTITDQAGSFRIPKPATGDQILSIDGTTIPVEVRGSTKKFFKTNISVSIGTRQSNVIDRPIHLAALMFDGSETNIPDINTSVVVESPQAPGVSLEIPTSTAVFPDDKKTGIINVAEIAAEYTSIPAFDFAKPNTVYAFEPSGLHFTTPVKLTLPNVNEIPAGVQMVIMSKNSEKGVWEIDGLARVSDDGSEIVTEPNGGITHFSEVYAAPVGPRISEYGGTGHIGADVFNGSLQNSIDLPSYKLFGKDFAANLSYHSNWANPYVVVSNVIDVPKNEFEFRSSGGVRGLFAKASVTVNGSSWIAPDFIDAEFYTENIISDKLRFTGIPQKAVVSYAMDLSSLPTGMQTYNSHYELHLKQMVVGTRTTRIKKRFGRTRTYQESFTETRKIEEAFPQDLGGALYLQNYQASKAGQGWRINGAGKIYNLNSPRILVEESNGGTTSYALNTNIETVYFNSSKTLRAVDLGAWPNINIYEPGGSLTKYNTIDKTEPKLVHISPYEGRIRGMTIDDLNPAACSFNCRTESRNYQFDSIVNSLITLNSKLFILTGEGNVKSVEANALQKISGRYTIPSDYTRPISQGFFTYTGPYCADALRSSCTNFIDKGFILNNCQAAASTFNVIINYCKSQGITAQSTGEIPAGLGFADGVDPLYNSLSSATNGLGDEIIVADFGNNRVRAVNIVTNTSRTIAGNGQTLDLGDGLVGTAASLFHPKGVASDAQGNIYISTENGFIRKLDPNGFISTFAGKANGILSDVTQAQDMRLNKPNAMVVDIQNNLLFVADTGHHRVVKIDLDSRIATTVAGSGACQSGNIGDRGAAITSSLCSPTTLGLDDQNNLLIFDQGHNRIRRVLLNNSTNGVLSYDSIAKDNSKLTRLADGTFLREFRNGSVLKYDNLGRQTISEDRIGNKFSFQYNADGSLASIIDPTSRATNYQYSGNKLERITDPQGRNTDFYYDGNTLSEVRFPDGSSRFFEYDANGLMTAETDKRGSKTNYAYNIWHRLQSVTLADNSTSVIQDGTSATIGNNFVSGQVGSLKSIDKNEIVDGIKDSKGQTTTLNKDENGFVSKITDARGNVYSIERDLDGRPTKITRPDDSYSVFTYDPLNADLITKFDSATNVTINYDYDAFGNLLTQSLPNGEVVTYDYDDNTGLLLSKTLPLNTVENFEYYANGLLKTKINPLGQRSSFVYGSNGNVVTLTDNANQSTQIVRDLSGNVLSVTNAKGQVTENTYDDFNRLLSVKSPKGEITSYEYLPSGELSKIIDPENNQTIYEYNLIGRLIRKTDPLGLKTELTYDLNGNVASETDPSGNVKTFTYDNLDRLVKKVLPDNVYEFTYDPRNNLESIRNSSSQITYAYLHREGGDLVTRETTIDGVIDYDYDVSGNRIEMATTEGSFLYTYDKLNRPTKVVNHKGEIFDNTFDTGSRLSKRRSPASVTNFSYDTVNFLTQINHQKRSDLSSISNLDYTRDSIGNITKMTSTRGEFAFVYDNNNQLINSTHPEDIASSFTYDSLGNRVTDQFGNFNYDLKKQRLLEDWKYIYSYDNNGNLSSKILKADNTKVTGYSHNSENQLVSIREYNGSTIIKETSYFYDAVGRRIRKEHVDHSNAANSFERNFRYDNQEILFELDGNDTLLSTFTHSGLRTDDVLAVDKSGTSYFYLKDHLGTVNDIISSAGSLVQHYVYSAFGKIIRIENKNGGDVTDAPLVDNFYTFTGREFDKESGLYYFRARYLDSDTGRFIQADPHQGAKNLPASFNSKYIYTLNDPINSIDPNGLFSFKKAFAISLAFVCPALAVAYINTTDVFSEKDTRRLTNAYITLVVVTAAFYLSPGIAFGVLAGTAYSRKDKGNPFDNLHFAGEFALSFAITYGASKLFPGGNDTFFGKQANEGFFTTANRTFVNSVGLTVGLSSFQGGLSSEERSERRGVGLFLLTLGTLAPN